jgi:DNA-binding transcriptional LysR family regulator
LDVVAEGFDLAIRVRFPPLEPSDLVMRRLDESTQCLVAAPSLVGAGLGSPIDLRNLPSLDLGPAHREHSWQLHHADGQVATIPHVPRLVTDDMSVLRDAAIAGVGAVQLPTIFIWDDVRAGGLVHVVPDWRPRAGIVHAVFPSRRGLLPSVRALVDFLARECSIQRARANRVLPPLDEGIAPK